MNFRKRFSLILILCAGSLGILTHAHAVTHVLTVSQTIGCVDMTYDGDTVIVNGATIDIVCLHSFARLEVINGGIVRHLAADTNGLQLNIAGDLVIDASSAINVNGRGYPQGMGPGTPTVFTPDGSGASYGGLGGISSDPGSAAGVHYGLIEAPARPGSGGGAGNSNGGGAGGGLIRLNVAGDVQLDGEISANGANGTTPNWSGGGGSGGAIRVICASFEGSGMFRANGGSGGARPAEGAGGGGGGGGRIAIDYATNTFTGTMQCCGGTTWQNSTVFNGGPGSIFLHDAALDETKLIVDNCANPGNLFVWYADPPQPAVTNFVARNSARVRVDGWSNLSRAVRVQNSAILEPQQLQTLYVLADSIVVEAGGAIDASAKGHSMDFGPTPGAESSDGGGGGHGGRGGQGSGALETGGGISGDFRAPTVFGSGGGGGANSAGGTGGGCVRLDAQTICIVDGAVRANGQDGWQPNWTGGGGAGGSVWITCTEFTGTGFIRANGGQGANYGYGGSGGGGGGRICVDYLADSYAGIITACGGPGWNQLELSNGGAGTVYLYNNALGVGNLTINNCSQPGAMTEFNSQNTVLGDVVVSAAAKLYPSTVFRCANLTLTGQSHVVTIPLRTIIIFASQNVTVEAGCSVDARGKGYAAQQGPGAGTSGNDGGGGGYGGAGGNGCTGNGGMAYGAECYNTSYGSGGGLGSSIAGGAGGGSIKIYANTISVSGQINANGQDGWQPNWTGGGGSGGGISLYAVTLSGFGTVTANGGNAGSYGYCGSGGGGGGRVILYVPYLMMPQVNITANGGLSGGGSSQPGQPGVVCIPEPADCNDNGISDIEEIALDPSVDSCPLNGWLDECDGFVAPTVLITYQGGALRLSWDCVYSAASYDVYTKLFDGAYELLANTADTEIDVTGLVDPLNNDRRTFYVVAIASGE